MKNKLKEIRISNDKTLKEVSDFLGIAISTLNGYENNYRQPKIEILNKLADYYNVSVTSLIGLDDNSASKEINSLKYDTVAVNYSDTDKLTFTPNNNNAKFADIAINQVIEWLDADKNLLYLGSNPKDKVSRQSELKLLEIMKHSFSSMRDDFQVGLDRNLVEKETEYIAVLNSYITTFNIFQNIKGLDKNIQDSLLKITNELRQNKKASYD